MSKTLDRVDRRILDTLQADARISNQELAKRVGLDRKSTRLNSSHRR